MVEKCKHSWRVGTGCPYCKADALEDDLIKVMESMQRIAEALDTVPTENDILGAIALLHAKTEHSLIVVHHRVYCSRKEPLELLKRMESENMKLKYPNL